MFNRDEKGRANGSAGEYAEASGGWAVVSKARLTRAKSCVTRTGMA
jgi:hypothetical protein